MESEFISIVTVSLSIATALLGGILLKRSIKIASLNAIMNLVFLLFVLGLDANHFLYLFLLYLFTGLSTSLWLRSPSSPLQFPAIFLLLIGLGIAKYSLFSRIPLFVPVIAFLDSGAKVTAVSVLGISYFVFRAIHFMVDVRAGAIKAFSWLDLFNFLFFFPSFLSGPLDRFQRFTDNQNKPAIGGPSFESGMERVFLGVIKKFGFAALFSSYSISVMSDAAIANMSILEIWARILACTMWIYFDFSGYCDFAIGIAKMMGINLPENFNNPFRATNIQDFWMRWHISLANWIRDYIFFPITKLFYKIFHQPKGAWAPALSLMLAFMFSGIWHGEGSHFLLWGLFHGIALGGLVLYRELAKKNFKKKYKKIKTSPWYLVSGWLFTFTFINLTSVLFFCELTKALFIYSKLVGM